jgi:hypothetical protein
MVPLNPPLNRNDFTNAPWKDVIDSIDRKDFFSYIVPFYKKSQEAEKSGNIREQAVFLVLAAATSSSLKPESTEESLADHFRNLAKDDLDFLADIVPEISDPELQARIADILWVKRRNYKMAQLAIPAYLKSADNLESPEEWNYCFDRICRALILSRQIKHEEAVVLNHIDLLLDRYKGEDPSLLSAKLMQLLQEKKLGDLVKYGDLSERAANFAESKSNWFKARILWNIKATWNRMQGDFEKEFSASMLAAETYVKEADCVLTTTPPSYILASRYLQQAVEFLRSIRGTKEETINAKARAKEVHKMLLQHQEKSRDELIKVSSQAEVKGINQIVDRAINNVRNKDFKETIFALALSTDTTNISQLRKQVVQQSHDIIGSDLFPLVVINEEGKITARQPAFDISQNPDQADKATYFAMCQNAAYYQKLQAQVCIEPARLQINLEHSVRINDIRSIIMHSPFVPPGREHLFAKGLYAGIVGDFFTSIHILIPQIENSVRHVMWQRGIIASGLNSSGIQEEHNLNTTLYHQKIDDIFDESTLFDLRCLLVEHAGSNLRNRIAHGLISDVEFMDPLMSYAWWLVLRLCCLPILGNQQELE